MKHQQYLFAKQITEREVTPTPARRRKGTKNWPAFQPSHSSLVSFFTVLNSATAQTRTLETNSQWLVNGYHHLQDIFGPGQLVLAQTVSGHSLGGATTQAWMQVLALEARGA